jgi:BNR repeat-like domain
MKLKKALQRTFFAMIGLLILTGYPRESIRGMQVIGGWSKPLNLDMDLGYSASIKQPYRPYEIILSDTSGGLHVFIPYTTSPGGYCLDTIFYWYYQGNWSVPLDVIAAEEGTCISYPQAAIDQRGILHMIWFQGTALMYSNVHISQIEDVRAWAEPVILASVYGQAQPPFILVDDNGTLHVIYPSAEQGIYYSSSVDGGLNWSSPITIVDNSTNIRLFGETRLAINSVGNLYATWSEYDPTNSDIVGSDAVMYARSVDDGQTWESKIIDSSQNPGYELSYGPLHLNVFAYQDEVHLVWDGAPRGQRHYLKSNDQGRTWSPPFQILGDLSGLTGFNEMQADSSGKIHLVTGGDDPNLGSNVFHSVWDGSEWSAPEIAIPGLGEDPKLAITQGNTLNIIDNLKRYSFKVVAAPLVPPIPLPTAENSPLIKTLTPFVSPSPSPVILLTNISDSDTHLINSTNPDTLTIGISISLVLLILVIIITLRSIKH